MLLLVGDTISSFSKMASKNGILKLTEFVFLLSTNILMYDKSISAVWMPWIIGEAIETKWLLNEFAFSSKTASVASDFPVAFSFLSAFHSNREFGIFKLFLIASQPLYWWYWENALNETLPQWSCFLRSLCCLMTSKRSSFSQGGFL